MIAGMDTTISATELLSRLSADEIRQRLADVEAESRALRTLLRVAVRAESGRKRTGDRAAAERQEAPSL